MHYKDIFQDRVNETNSDVMKVGAFLIINLFSMVGRRKEAGSTLCVEEVAKVAP
jgi:hypothetical protein